MLHDYITDYISASERGDYALMDEIEKDLAKVGMDKQTLIELVDELKREARNDQT